MRSPSNRFPSKLTNVPQRQGSSIVRLRQSPFCMYRRQKLQFLEGMGEVLEELSEAALIAFTHCCSISVADVTLRV